MSEGVIDFYLASASPRRRELLRQLGYRFDVRAVAVEECPQPAEDPSVYVQRLACAKASATRAALARDDTRAVLGADTEVVIDGEILGKPSSLPGLRRMLGLLGGRTHRVLSAVALDAAGTQSIALSVTEVRMRALTDSEIEAYWASGEPRDKAGGYAIQGLAAEFVAGIDGSYSGVVGLPLFETAALLRARGILGWQGGARA